MENTCTASHFSQPHSLILKWFLISSACMESMNINTKIHKYAPLAHAQALWWKPHFFTPSPQGGFSCRFMSSHVCNRGRKSNVKRKRATVKFLPFCVYSCWLRITLSDCKLCFLLSASSSCPSIWSICKWAYSYTNIWACTFFFPVRK